MQVWKKFLLAEKGTPHNPKAKLLQRSVLEVPFNPTYSFYDLLMEHYPQSHCTVTIHVGDSHINQKTNTHKKCQESMTFFFIP